MLDLLLDMLRERVGGMITLSNLANALQVAPKTAKHWLEIFERRYLLFPVYAYTKKYCPGDH